MSSSGSLKRPSDEIDPLAQPSKRERETPAESSHDGLDQQVMVAMDGQPYSSLLLLLAIVTFSEGKLDPKYKDIRHAKAILKANPPLTSQLKAAWEKKSFKEIRDLGMFKDFWLLLTINDACIEILQKRNEPEWGAAMRYATLSLYLLTRLLHDHSFSLENNTSKSRLTTVAYHLPI